MSAKKERRLSSLLLADDGSAHARAAASLLCDLSQAKDTPLTVLRAFASTQATEVFALETYLQLTCDLLRAKGFQPTPELVLGSPAEKIIEYALAKRPQLILMGAKGLRSTFGILLGGVAQQVVEYACCPVLVVRAPYRGIKHILLATDGSPCSQEAIRYMAVFPWPQGVKVTVMHVLPPPPPPAFVTMEPGYMASPLNQPIELTEADLARRSQEEKAGKLLLEQTARQLAEYGLKAATRLSRGDAASEIMDFVKSGKVDLIVTGSRGLSQMKAWLLGSVSRKLVHYSNCSVLVVRGPEA